MSLVLLSFPDQAEIVTLGTLKAYIRMYIPLSYLLVCLHTSAFASDVLIRGRNPDAALAKKAVCYSDNVLRALRANSASASPFCSSLIDIPGTTTFKSVAGVTATTYGLLLSLPMKIPASPHSSVANALFCSVAVTSTRVSTITPNFPSPLPTYVSQYSTAQVSSACSCLSVPTSTETYTASTSTVVSFRVLSTMRPQSF